MLTAAHLPFDGPAATTVYFQTSAGDFAIEVEAVTRHPNYDAANAANDLALLQLKAPVSITADRYQLYHDSDDIGQDFTFLGYGLSGTGSSGAHLADATPTRRLAQNTFDGDVEVINQAMGQTLNWSPLSGTQLFADFDDGSLATDASALLFGLPDPGLGLMEGMLASGDSGGPAFIDGLLAGVASYGASLADITIHPDADGTTNATFGEIGVWQRLTAYNQWLDQTMRAAWPEAPTSPAEVRTSVTETDSGVHYAFFMVQLSNPTTDGGSVAYRTVNGSATAGEDYLAASGRLVLYPGENQALIPVEIIGDTMAEDDETFFLEIFDPIGGTFAGDQSVLMAMRTITDDDAQHIAVMGVQATGEPWPLMG